MKNKIVYVESPLASPGGGQFSLLIILKGINKDNFERVVYLPGESEYANWLRESNIDIEFVQLLGFLKKFKEDKPELIHCNSSTNKYTFFAALSAKLLGIPFIWHVRVVDSAGWRDRVIGSLSSKIIVISEAVKKRFLWAERKVIKIHNVVDVRSFQPGLNTDYLRKEFDLSSEERVVGMFARLDPWKGHKLLFDAIVELKAKFPKIKFLIVGAGNQEYKKELLNDIDRLGINQNVILTGFRSDVPQLMNLCEVMVNPTINPEPFGRSIIEAMACHTPVIATKMGGPLEIISDQENGLLVEPEVEPLVGAIEKLLNDEKLRGQLADVASKDVIERFSISKQMKLIEGVYGEFTKTS